MVKITLAKESDLKKIYELELLCFPIDYFKLSEYKKYFKKPSVKIYVLKQDEQIVATAMLMFRKNSKKVRIYSFAVHPGYQKKGIAQTLYDTLEVHIKGLSGVEIYLEVKKDNIPAIKFYQKNGFAIFSEYKNYYNDGKDAFRMKKKL